jgi:hypothetical protein
VILLPRTIRLDPSDTVVFARAAEPGEGAVPGTFLFSGRDPESLGRKEKVAFRSGFLGIDSFGHSTLVVVQQASPAERAATVERLARQLVERLGPPDERTARPAAEEEITFAADLCRCHALNTLIALHRGREEDGSIRERFRTLKPRDETAFSAGYLQGHDKAFFIVESEEEDEGHAVDLLALRGGKDV